MALRTRMAWSRPRAQSPIKPWISASTCLTMPAPTFRSVSSPFRPKGTVLEIYGVAELAAVLAALVGVGAVTPPEPVVCALAFFQDCFGTGRYEFCASGHGLIVPGDGQKVKVQGREDGGHESVEACEGSQWIHPVDHSSQTAICEGALVRMAGAPRRPLGRLGRREVQVLPWGNPPNARSGTGGLLSHCSGVCSRACACLYRREPPVLGFGVRQIATTAMHTVASPPTEIHNRRRSLADHRILSDSRHQMSWPLENCFKSLVRRQEHRPSHAYLGFLPRQRQQAMGIGQNVFRDDSQVVPLFFDEGHHPINSIPVVAILKEGLLFLLEPTPSDGLGNRKVRGNVILDSPPIVEMPDENARAPAHDLQEPCRSEWAQIQQPPTHAQDPPRLLKGMNHARMGDSSQRPAKDSPFETLAYKGYGHARGRGKTDLR